ncbi:MAG: HD domain-containing protein [Phycisphaerales bacterium]|nr:HD domain-containing protein [Phycisphaerales bacterium]
MLVERERDNPSMSDRNQARPGRIEWSFRPRSRAALFAGVLLFQAAVLLGGELLADYWLRSNADLAGVWADRLLVFRLSVALGVFLLTAAILFMASRRYQDTVEHANTELQAEVARQVRDGLAKRNALIFGLAKLADYRDTDTGAHLERIGLYARLLANQLRPTNPGIDDAWTERLVLASSLHDIGKVGIPDRILLKPGRLDDAERAEMEKHTLIGADTLIAIRQKLGPDPFLDMGVEIALQHHEKWDGTGYPFRLAGEEISLAARIVAMADFYDAVTSERVYKKAMTHAETHELILSLRGTHFDPAVVDAYLACADRFDRVRGRACRDLTHPGSESLESMAREFMAEQDGLRLAA